MSASGDRLRKPHRRPSSPHNRVEPDMLKRLTTLLGTSLLGTSLALTVAIAFAGAQQSPPPPTTPPTPVPGGQAGRGGAPVQGAEPDIPVLARFDRDGNKRLD